jgi:hypothetical protein
MPAILKEFHRKHTAKMRVVEVSFGLLLCILASIAMTSLVSHVSRTIAIPYVSSSDKHEVAVKSEKTSTPNDTGAASQPAGHTSPSPPLVAASADPNTVSPAPASAPKPRVSATVSIPVAGVGPVHVEKTLPKQTPLCKVPVSVTLPVLSIHTCE